MRQYDYPPNARAAEANMREQAAKCLEEAVEVTDAYIDMAEAPSRTNCMAFYVEAIDLWVAASELVAKIPEESYAEAHAFVSRKNHARGGLVMGELKPCPFCGGEAKLEHYWNGKLGVSCADANCKGFWSVKDTEEEAVTAWNTRAERTCDECANEGADWCEDCARNYADLYVPKEVE